MSLTANSVGCGIDGLVGVEHLGPLGRQEGTAVEINWLRYKSTLLAVWALATGALAVSIRPHSWSIRIDNKEKVSRPTAFLVVFIIAVGTVDLVVAHTLLRDARAGIAALEAAAATRAICIPSFNDY